MQRTGDVVNFSSIEQQMFGLPAEVHVDAAAIIINNIELQRTNIYHASCQPSEPGTETEARNAAFNYATDLGIVARKLMQLAGLDGLVFAEE